MLQDEPQLEKCALVDLAAAQFARDLPSLVLESPHEWVIYRGRDRLGLGSDETALVRRWTKRFPLEELLIRKVEPDAGSLFTTW
jgi:hypothetical protein